jgi:hypothetical protein
MATGALRTFPVSPISTTSPDEMSLFMLWSPKISAIALL